MATSRPSTGGFFLAEVQPRLGEMLLARGLITTEQLRDALAAREPGERLGEALVRLRIVFENDLARTLATQCGFEYVDLSVSGVDRGCARLLPRTTARSLGVVPVRSTSEGAVVVAVGDPLEVDLELVERTLGTPLEVKVAELSAIRTVLDVVWPDHETPEAEPPGTPPFRIRVAAAERTEALRDYLRRLGADASTDSPGTISVAAGSLLHVSEAGERADLVTYLRAWSARHGVAAQLVE